MPISFDDVCDYILSQNSSPKLRYLLDYLNLNLNARFPQQKDQLEIHPVERLKALDKALLKSVRVEITFDSDKFMANELPFINAQFFDHAGQPIVWGDLINQDLETLTAIELCLVSIYNDHIRPLLTRQYALRKQLVKEIEDLTKGKESGPTTPVG